MRRPPLNKRSGLSLVEAILSLSLLAIITAGAVESSMRAMAAIRTSSAQSQINARSHRAMARVLEVLETMAVASLSPSLVTPDGMPRENSDFIDFRTGDGWNAGAPVWSTPTRLAFEREETELDNGVDDDGDGLVDEGLLVLIRDLGGPDQSRTVLASGLRGYQLGELRNGLDDNGDGVADEHGLLLTRDNNVLNLTLCFELPNPDGGTLIRTLRNSLRIRN